MLSLDGLPLTSPGKWRLNTDTRLKVLPERTAFDGVLPGRDGTVPSLGSAFQPGAAILGLTLYGSSRADVESNTEALFGVLGQRRRTLRLLDSVRSREAEVEVLTLVEPQRVGARMWRISVPVRIPGGFWRGPSLTDSPLTLTTSTASTPATGLAGSTAPVNDALIRVQGGFTSSYVEDVVTGDRVTINAAVSSNEFVVIDAAAWTARKVSSDTWAGGSNIISSVVSNRGSGPMIGFEPDFATGAGRIRVRTVGTGISGSPSVLVRAKPSFL